MDEKTWQFCCECSEPLDSRTVRYGCFFCGTQHCDKCCPACKRLHEIARQNAEKEKQPCPICGAKPGDDPGPHWCDRWGCNEWHCDDHDCTPCLVCDCKPTDVNSTVKWCASCRFHHCDQCECPDPERAQEKLDWIEKKENGY